MNAILVEVIQFERTYESIKECEKFCPGIKVIGTDKLELKLPNGGTDTCYNGDWLVKDSFGNYYIVSEEDFETKIWPA